MYTYWVNYWRSLIWTRSKSRFISDLRLLQQSLQIQHIDTYRCYSYLYISITFIILLFSIALAVRRPKDNYQDFLRCYTCTQNEHFHFYFVYIVFLLTVSNNNQRIVLMATQLWIITFTHLNIKLSLMYQKLQYWWHDMDWI